MIFGGVSQKPQIEALRRGLDVLVATPGRLLDLMEQGYQPENIVLCGHSRGAYAALAATSELEKQGTNIKACYIVNPVKAFDHVSIGIIGKSGVLSLNPNLVFAPCVQDATDQRVIFERRRLNESASGAASR